MLLADKGNVSELSYVRDDGELYADIYKSVNGTDLAGGACALMEHWLPTSEEIGQIFSGLSGWTRIFCGIGWKHV